MRTVLYIQLSSGMGGSTHSLLLLARHVREHGYRAIIAGPQDREGLCEEAERLDIPYYPLYLASWARSDLHWRDLLYIPNRLNTLRRLAAICRRERVDIVHSNLANCLDGALAAHLLDLPHVFHIREEFRDLYRTYWGGTRGAVTVLRRLSDRVIAVSRSIAASFAEHGAGDTTCVIPNAVQVPPVPPGYQPAAVRAAYGLPVEAPIVAVIGTIAARKGQIDLVRAIELIAEPLPDVHAAIVGDGYDDYAALVRAEIARLGLVERIHVMPHQRDIWPLLRAVDIVAVPSRAEGFGRIVIEAMGAGKPVIGAATGGIVDIIRDGENGLLVPAASPQHLAAAILRLLDDPAYRHRLAAAGERRARQDYCPTMQTRRVASLYDDLLAGEPLFAGAMDSPQTKPGTYGR